MKSSMKKLAVFVIIAAIAMFTVVATASAGDYYPKAIWGQYAATGSQTCLLALCGVDTEYVPIGSGTGSVQSLNIEAVFKFKPDGNGTASMTKRSINLPPTLPTIPSASAGVVADSFNFTYTVKDDGTVTMQVVPGTYTSTWTYGPYKGASYTVYGVSFEGTITPDGMMLTLNSGMPSEASLTPPIVPPCGDATLICNTSLVLIRKGE